MNIIFFLIMLFFVALFFLGIKQAEEGIALTGFFVVMIMLLTSAFLEFGNPRIVKITNFTLEKTPYRIFITIDDGEFNLSKEFRNAIYVNKADSIKSVTLKIPHNAWGSEMTNCIEIKPDVP